MEARGATEGDQPEPLAGRSGVVTGAGGGIGRATAIRLAALGANVGVNYWHNEKGAKETVGEVERLGRRAVLLPGDAGAESDVRRIARFALESLGPIDFLVNNAGGGEGAKGDDPIDIADFGDWNRILASNLGSTFLCTRHFAPGMVERRSGRIVNISSVCGLTGDCGPAYCAAKAGVLGLTRHSAVALAPYVQVNAILPGFVDSAPHDPKKVGRITPGRKMGHPEEIADLVGYLVATPQKFLTGACIVMDGSVMNGIIGRMMEWDYSSGVDERSRGSR